MYISNQRVRRASRVRLRRRERRGHGASVRERVLLPGRSSRRSRVCRVGVGLSGAQASAPRGGDSLFHLHLHLNHLIVHVHHLHLLRLCALRSELSAAAPAVARDRAAHAPRAPRRRVRALARGLDACALRLVRAALPSALPSASRAAERSLEARVSSGARRRPELHLTSLCRCARFFPNCIFLALSFTRIPSAL